MAFWNFYFLIKLFLFWQNRLGFHPWKNLFFAIFLLVPLKNPRWVALRWMIAVPVGVALFYHDSLLPSPARVWSQVGNIGAFSGEYMLELLGRVFDWKALLALFVLIVGYFFANRYVRVTTFVLIALVALAAKEAVTTFFPQADESNIASATSDVNSSSVATSSTLPPANNVNLNRYFDNFFSREASRSVTFTRPQASFDIVFIHICSLAWDDLKTTALDKHPLFKKFNVVFQEFNSAASYSGPAAIRLLRSNCGQERHAQLFGAASPQCFTFDALRNVGFEAQWLMNHDGHFGNFRDDVSMRGGIGVQPLINTKAKVAMHAFDETPIYDDYDELSHWWNERLASPAAQTALYYNTISLHDGNKLPSGDNSMKTYPRRAGQLFDDIDRFFNLLEASGRKVVVVMVPEHGAALHGDGVQIAGMREIPTPQITLAPVGVKFIGMSADEQQHVVNQSTSYFALATLLSNTMQQYQENTALNVGALVKDLPETPYIAENESLAVMKYGANYYSRNSEGVWIKNEK